MGSSFDLRLNVIVCGVNQVNEEIINKLFPVKIEEEENKRKRENKDDKIFYTARIFRGHVSSENNLNTIKNYIHNNFAHFHRKKTIAKNVVLYFSDENATLQQNSNVWVNIANKINTLPEIELPFIIFLSYG